jgi:hypothetical protein
MSIAEELQSQYERCPAEIVDLLVDRFWVKKLVVVGDDDDPSFFFVDGSSISKRERVAYPPSKAFLDEQKDRGLDMQQVRKESQQLDEFRKWFAKVQAEEAA